MINIKSKSNIKIKEKINIVSINKNDEFIVNIIDDGINSAVYLTDTGYINRKYYELTKNKTIYHLKK